MADVLKPVLVGMNNPQSDGEHYALYPLPEGCTGNRIWRMLNDSAICSMTEYRDSFQRLNVLEGRRWSLPEARRVAPEVWRRLDGRTVCLLGRPVLEALGVQAIVEPLVWQAGGTLLGPGRPARWCYVPHPSGRNHWYSEPANGAAVGRLLAELLNDYRGRAK